MVAPIKGLALALLSLLMLLAPARGQTATPIEHLIVVVGENLSFDNLFWDLSAAVKCENP
jgi:phospholipase C